MRKALLDELYANLAYVIIECGQREVTMDDATNCGTVMVDPDHKGNAGQNALGHVLPALARKGYLRRTDRSVQAKAAYRKGGSHKVWLVTEAGVRWARSITLNGNEGGQPDSTGPSSDAGAVSSGNGEGEVRVEDVPVPPKRRLKPRRSSYQGRQRPPDGGAEPHEG